MITSIIAFVLWNICIFFGFCIVANFCRARSDGMDAAIRLIFTICAATLIVFF